MQVIECARCGRALKNPKARELGYGLICWRKIQGERAREQRNADDSIVITPTITDGYAGARGPGGTVKVVRIRNGVQEPLRHLVHHSPDGFNWGYGGSGPADLARSIIGDVLGTTDPEPEIYQEFKRDFIAGLYQNQWEIPLVNIELWLKFFRVEREKAAL